MTTPVEPVIATAVSEIPEIAETAEKAVDAATPVLEAVSKDNILQKIHGDATAALDALEDELRQVRLQIARMWPSNTHETR